MAELSIGISKSGRSADQSIFEFWRQISLVARKSKLWKNLQKCYLSAIFGAKIQIFEEYIPIGGSHQLISSGVIDLMGQLIDLIYLC